MISEYSGFRRFYIDNFNLQAILKLRSVGAIVINSFYTMLYSTVLFICSLQRSADPQEFFQLPCDLQPVRSVGAIVNPRDKQGLTKA